MSKLTTTKPKYTVRHMSGQIVKPGDELTDFRGEKWYYLDCYHPRKLCVTKHPRTVEGLREFYPSVFKLQIAEA